MPSEMEQTYKNDTTIFDIFPFLLSFPFHDYSITLEQGVDYLDDLGIDPVVLSAGGGGIATPLYANVKPHDIQVQPPKGGSRRGARPSGNVGCKDIDQGANDQTRGRG